MKQTVVAFDFGLTREGVHVTTKIEDQINDFLREHPNYSIHTMIPFNTSMYQEALVTFNIHEENEMSKLLRNDETRGEREPVKKEYRPNGQDRSSRKT